jgi:hypothetical protein
MLWAMSGKHRRRRQAASTDRPLLAERIQRNPVLRFLGSLMVVQAMWRRNNLGEGSVAPVPERLTPDPVSDAPPDNEADDRRDG